MSPIAFFYILPLLCLLSLCSVVQNDYFLFIFEMIALAWAMGEPGIFFSLSKIVLYSTRLLRPPPPTHPPSAPYYFLFLEDLLGIVLH